MRTIFITEKIHEMIRGNGKNLESIFKQDPAKDDFKDLDSLTIAFIKTIHNRCLSSLGLLVQSNTLQKWEEVELKNYLSDSGSKVTSGNYMRDYENFLGNTTTLIRNDVLYIIVKREAISPLGEGQCLEDKLFYEAVLTTLGRFLTPADFYRSELVLTYLER